MFRTFLFIIVLSISSCLNAAAPITHAYLTKRFFLYFPKYSKTDQNNFMVGTLFPDIRYLGEASRKETHFENITLAEVLAEKDPFVAGVKFHSYVDEVREAMLVEEKLYDKVRETIPIHTATFIKIAEDEVLYQENRWSDILVPLISLHPKEKTYNISDKILYKWHKLLTLYFISSPSLSLNIFALTGKGAAGISPEEVQSWNKLMKPMTKENLINGWVWKMVRHFENEFKTFSEVV